MRLFLKPPLALSVAITRPERGFDVETRTFRWTIDWVAMRAYKCLVTFLAERFSCFRVYKRVIRSSPALATDRKVPLALNELVQFNWLCKPWDFSFERATSLMAVPECTDPSALVIDTAIKLHDEEYEYLNNDEVDEFDYPDERPRASGTGILAALPLFGGGARAPDPAEDASDDLSAPEEVAELSPSELEKEIEDRHGYIDMLTSEEIEIGKDKKRAKKRMEIYRYKRKALREVKQLEAKLAKHQVEPDKPTEEQLQKQKDRQQQIELKVQANSEMIRWGAKFDADEFVLSLRDVNKLPTSFTLHERYLNALWEGLLHDNEVGTDLAKYMHSIGTMPTYIRHGIEVGFLPGDLLDSPEGVQNREAMMAIKEMKKGVPFEKTRLKHLNEQVNNSPILTHFLKLVFDEVFGPDGRLGGQRQVHTNGTSIDQIITTEVKQVFIKLGISYHPLGKNVYTWLGPLCVRRCREFSLSSVAQLNHSNERVRLRAGIKFGPNQ